MSRGLISLEYYLGLALDLLPVVVMAGIVCVLVLRKKGRRLTCWRSVSMVLFVCYLAGLLALTAVPANLWRHFWYVLRHHRHSGIFFHLFTFEYSLIPDFWRHFGLEHLGNLLLYLPLGFFVPLLWEKARGWRVPALGFGLSLCVETIQLFVGRSLDANDLILNTAGAAAGYFLFLLLRAAAPSFVERCREEEL